MISILVVQAVVDISLLRPLHKPLEREDTPFLFVYLKNIGTRDDENRLLAHPLNQVSSLRDLVVDVFPIDRKLKHTVNRVS
ncbi:MAG: hypothetical protein LBP56_04900, partial [Odoribacteraceae bacterium]|nr:hypothetical protein [Odoribacteraceae bacterium]